MIRIFQAFTLFAALLLSLVIQAQDLVTAVVAERDFPTRYEFDGRIEAVNRATVSSRIAAEVIEINFDVDDRVPQDAVLIRFKDDEIRSRLKQAESALLAEKAQYQEALARLKQANAEAKRMTDLYARKQVTLSSLDQAQADQSAARARVDALSAQIKTRQAQVDEAKVELSYTIVRAPYAGVVTERHIEVGEMASPGQLLMSGMAFEQLRAVTQIPQRLLEKVMAAQTVYISSDGDNQLIGTDKTLIPAADPATHNFELRVSLPETDARLYPGSMVKLVFVGDNTRLLVIPTQALAQRSEVSGVYVLTEHGIQFRQIRTGKRPDKDWVEVLSGLRVGETVAMDPVSAIQQRKSQKND